MRNFNDTKNGIKWIEHGIYGKKLINSKIPEISKSFEILNSWSKDTQIQEFITLKKAPLGDFIKDQLEKSDTNPIFEGMRQYYAYEDNELIGTIVGKIIVPHTFTIDYIVINPNKRKKGYGTRMISSLKENTHFFSNTSKTHNFTAIVHNDNIQSNNFFLKNKFKVFKPFHTEIIGSNMPFKMLTCSTKNKNGEMTPKDVYDILMQ